MTTSIPGFSSTLTATKVIAEPWKLAVAHAVGTRWSHGFLREPISLELKFGLPSGRFPNTALVNLLKSTIDGLSSVIFYPSSSGHSGQWSREDWWIDGLIAEKQTTLDPWVEITIAPATVPTPRTALRKGSLLIAVIPGEPPPWPGDRAGQARVLEWPERAIGICGLRSGAPSHIGGLLEFVVSPVQFRRVDLDNLCVPAGQTLAAVAFGDIRAAPRIVRIVATKRAVARDEAPHTRLELFMP